ncbi:hypothetical protein Tco_0651817 [Tanacetum coccineum]|uniref:Uncharacterized protein n=1 Tax=Tanacetum coccineum TaxID=301880 RepID=A0ABQ4WW38_9ASTR
MPEQMRVGEFLPPYYIFQLGDSIIIFGSFSFDDFRILYAWDLQVDDGEVSSYRQLFTIPYPAEHELKLLGFIPSTPLIYFGGSSRNGECSNCKLLLARIKLLEAQMEMYMHPRQHTLNSTALLHEVYNDMGKLGLE